MKHSPWLFLLIGSILILGRGAPGAGILAPTDESIPPLRITDHVVDVNVSDGIAITELTQTFRNETRSRLEATYLFPLPEQADLTNFAMSFNGKMVEGEVLPAEEAAKTYESIVRQMRDPGLIEFIGRRLLKMRVFPVEPQSDTTIKLRYQQICRPVSGMSSYHYPLRTRKTSGQAYGTVRFNVKLETKSPLKNIWSPTHAVEIVRNKDDRSALIGYEASGGSLEDDFLLLYDTDGSDVGLNVVASGSGAGGHFVLMLTPKQLWPERTEQPQDVVFVLDTSGSMAGDKIDQARRAIKYCVDQLDDRDRFSVVRFSTGFDMLYDQPKAATREHRAEAKKWIDGFRAAGGTNITDTLSAVLEMRVAMEKSERPFVTVFLTDGRGNRKPEEILNTLRESVDEPKTVRIFPFGVGHDVNTRVLDGLAEDFTGRTTYVQPGEDLELVLGDFFAVVSRPVLTNLKLVMPEIGVTERFPAALGDLYHGQQLVVAGRFRNAGSGPVKLIASRDGERVEYAWPDISFVPAPNTEYVETVWAGRKIAYLIDQIRAHGESTEMIEEIIALSREHGIQTPYSSWFVNPEGTIVRDRRRPTPPPRTVPALRRVAGQELEAPPAGGLGAAGGRGLGGGGDANFDLSAETGADAVRLAKINASLRESQTRDSSRADDRANSVKIGTKFYNRIGAFLVHEAYADDDTVHVVRFASDAWFELVRAREDLRLALARQALVVVMLDADTAVLVSQEQGIEEFSDEQRELLGLPVR